MSGTSILTGSDWRQAWRRGGGPLRVGLIGAGVLFLAHLCAVSGRYDAGADTDLSRRFAAPGSEGPWWHHPLGRDLYGRDLAAVMVEGTRAFWIPGWIAVLVALPIGLGLALARPQPGQGLTGERTLTLAVTSLPVLVWLLLASVAGGQRPGWVAVALGLTRVPDLTSSLRARFGLLARDGVLEGARAHGVPAARIRWVYLAWLEALPVLARQGARLMAAMLWAEASLSYLGDFGVPEPIPSWGRLLRDLSPLLFRAEPGAALWVALVPLSALVLVTVILLNLGEGLARAADRGWQPGLERRPAAAAAAGVAEGDGASRRSAGEADVGSRKADVPDGGHRGLTGPVADAGAGDSRVLLEVQGLTLASSGRRVLEDISFTVAAGETLAVVGESGAGKTLLMRAVLGMLPAGIERVAGEVRVAGPSGGAPRARRFAWVGQDAVQSFDPLRPVGDQLADAMGDRSSRREASRLEAERLLRRMDLPSVVRTRYANELSGGMARRAALAWALAGGAPLVLADEPTTGVDPPRLLDLIALLTGPEVGPRGLVLVTHDLVLAARVADRVIVLHRGRLVEAGPTRQVLERPAHPYVRHLVASAGALREGTAGLERLPVLEPLYDRGCPYRAVCGRMPAGVSRCDLPPPLILLDALHAVRCHHATAGGLEEDV